VLCRAVELGLVSHWTSTDDDETVKNSNSSSSSSSSKSDSDSGSGSSAANVRSSKYTAATMTIDLHGMTVPLAHSVRSAQMLHGYTHHNAYISSVACAPKLCRVVCISNISYGWVTMF
jgi:hypothetical protein